MTFIDVPYLVYTTGDPAKAENPNLIPVCLKPADNILCREFSRPWRTSTYYFRLATVGGVLNAVRRYPLPGFPVAPADSVEVDPPEVVAHLNRRAYSLWEREGRPDGQSDLFWQAAKLEIFPELATGQQPCNTPSA